jgi:NAD(P)-dependent dehydrogenase (short-subunit alcohol dehydrogenase family)
MRENIFPPNGWTPDRMGDLTGKTYVITGATSGTGKEAAKNLIACGASVVMLNRNPEKSQSVIAAIQFEFGADAPICAITLDLSDLSSVRSAAAQVLETTPKINTLICNAAIAQVPKQKLTIDGFESQLGTNHYGHFLLCNLLFDRIESSAGRIVVVSSLGYKMGLKTIQFDDMNWDKNYHQNKTYCHSKLAQMMFAYALQEKISIAGLSTEVFVCHPGASRTSLIETSANQVSKIMFKIMEKMPFMQSATHGAYPQLMCATEPCLEQRAFYGPVGRLETRGPVGKGILHDYAYDPDVISKLWTVSEQETQCTWSI